MYRIAFVPILALGWVTDVSSQVDRQSLTGLPSFVVYEPKIQGTNLGINSLGIDSLGRIIVTSGSSITSFDGNAWTTYTLKKTGLPEAPTVIFTTELSSNGKLYCSTDQGIYRIEFAPGDTFILEPTPISTGREFENLNNFRKSFSVGNRLYFFTEDTIANLNATDGSVTLLPHLSTTLLSVTSFNDKIYAFGADGSAHSLEQEIWTPLSPISGETNQIGVRLANQWRQHELIVAPDYNGLQRLEGNSFKDWPTELDRLENIQLLSIEPISEEHLAVSVDNSGIYILDTNGNIVQLLSRYIDYRFGNVRRLKHVGNGVLWGISDNSIIRINTFEPLTEYSTLLPYSRSFPRVFWHNESIYVTTNGKLVKSESFDGGALSGFTRVGEKIKNNIANATSAKGGILCSDGEQLYFIRDDGILEEIANLPRVSLIVVPEANPNIAIATAKDRYHLLKKGETGWQLTEKSLPSPGYCYFSRKSKPHEYWMEHGTGSVARLTIAGDDFALESYNTQNGLSNVWINIWNLDSTIVLSGGKDETYLTFDEESESLQPLGIKLLDDIYQTYPGVTRPAKDSIGNIWIPTSGVHLVLQPNSQGDYDINTEILMSVKNETLTHAFPDTNGEMLLTGEQKIYNYNPRFEKGVAEVPKAQIFKIESLNDSTIIYDTRNLENSRQRPLTVPFTNNHLEFEVSTLTIAYNAKAGHEYRINRKSELWTPFPASNRFSLNNLKEGNYTISVRPRFNDLIGTETSISFKVLPPYYRTKTAYLIYVVLGLGFLAAVTLLTRSLSERKNRLLSQLVKVRTRELEVANNELTKLVHKAQSATTAKTAFLQSISHEMRTPLNGIIGPTSILLRETTDKNSLEFLEIIRKSGNRLNKIVNEVLEYIDSESDREKKGTTVFNLFELCHELEEDFTKTAITQNLEFHIEIDHKLPRYWEGDPIKIRQALCILLENAFKFTKKGGVRLKASHIPSATKTKIVQFEVADTGIGIDSELLKVIFEPFQQGKDEFGGAHDGTGIGLSICMQLVRFLNGTIDVKSAIDEGSVFTIKIPLTKGVANRTLASLNS